MEKTILIELTEQGLSINQLSIKLKESKSTIRYWLTKFQLKTKNPNNQNRKITILPIHKNCPRCNSIKPSSEFYKRRNRIGLVSYCKTCTTEQTVERMREFKIKCVEYKGGKCQICPYNRYIGALEFHHLDPTKKDFNISHIKAYSFSNIIKKELDKCILVCSNCHREIHAGLIKL